MRTLTSENVINFTLTFKPDALRAIKALARTKPWKGEWNTRFDAMSKCLRAICKAYDLEPWQLTHVGAKSGCSGASQLRSRLKRVELRGRLSVVTMLHLFAKARFGCTDQAAHVRAIRWSATVFKRCFPISFSRCHIVNGLLVNDGRRDE